MASFPRNDDLAKRIEEVLRPKKETPFGEKLKKAIHKTKKKK